MIFDRCLVTDEATRVVCLFLESGSGICCINQADFKFIEIHLCLPLIMCFKMKD